MDRTLLEMAVELVLSQSEQRLMSGEDLDQLLKQTYRSLKEIQAAESGGDLGDAETAIEPYQEIQKFHSKQVQTATVAQPAPVIDPSEAIKSIEHNRIVCLECGIGFRQLSHLHLKQHNLTVQSYRQKYGFSSKQALSARAVSEIRKRRAKQLGTGQRLKMAREAKKSNP